MKRASLLCALIALSAFSAFAQDNAAYRFDNFDTKAGVNVAFEPKPAPTPQQKRNAASSKKLRLALKSAAPTIPADENLQSSPQPLVSSSQPGRLFTAAISKSLDGFTTGDANVDKFIVESGTRNGVDPVLLYAIMHRESAFKKNALSHKGARGLMQLMPGTAVRFGVKSIFDPQQNIEGGARYMRFLLNQFDGDVPLALAGYNAGEGAVMKYGYRIPPYRETQEYVRRISQRYALMRNPQTARIAPVISPAQVATIKEPPPPVYERSVSAVRLPDGKLILLSQ